MGLSRRKSAHPQCTPRSRICLFRIAIVLFSALATMANAEAQQEQLPAANPIAAQPTDQSSELQFSFEATPWREVIKWLADEADMALHVGDLPTGSFTYTDADTFTPQQAIDRVNLFLLPQGFTLIRSGKMLSVINLGDPRSMQQLDALAKMVTIDQLGELETHDVVKCLFPLGELKADDAVEELTALKLMTTPAVFSKTNQLMITDTAGKLRNVKAILDAFQPQALDNGTVVKTFALKHVDAEDILVVARPHLGLATGETIGIDVSLSYDLQGKNIFVTGVEDKVKLIEGLVTAIDVPQADSATDAESELRSHFVKGGNVEMVYNVLLTLLAGKTVRLSMDEEAGSIVALATPDVQREIAATVTQLQASEADFEVIPLKTVDPYFAISLLEEMLDLPDPYDDPDDIDPDAPKIDADPANMRLFVRAKDHQIEQIKKIVAGLDASSPASSGDEIRILPLKGEEAEQALHTAAKFWRAANPIVLYGSTDKAEPAKSERVVSEDSSRSGTDDRSRMVSNSTRARLLTDNNLSQAPIIRCQLTQRGLLLQSDDTEALDQFEEHLLTVAGPTGSTPSPPVVFYLKYTKSTDAIRMLAELLDGGETANEGSAGSLVNGYVSSAPNTYLGSIVTSQDGTTTMMAGSMTVVADSRLNRLIAQGTGNDIERIEDYLKIIDKDRSLTSIETYGTSHVIELAHMKASEAATVIREAYAGRVEGGSNNGGARASNQPGSPQQRKPDEGSGKSERDEDGKKQSQKASGGQPARSLEPKMTIAVHEPSNSLIVTAPDQLFQQVENLVKLMDARSEKVVRVVPVTNPVARMLLLQQANSAGAKTSSGRTESSSRTPTPFPARSQPVRSTSPLQFKGLNGGR